MSNGVCHVHLKLFLAEESQPLEYPQSRCLRLTLGVKHQPYQRAIDTWVQDLPQIYLDAIIRTMLERV